MLNENTWTWVKVWQCLILVLTKLVTGFMKTATLESEFGNICFSWSQALWKQLDWSQSLGKTNLGEKRSAAKIQWKTRPSFGCDRVRNSIPQQEQRLASETDLVLPLSQKAKANAFLEVQHNLRWFAILCILKTHFFFKGKTVNHHKPCHL